MTFCIRIFAFLNWNPYCSKLSQIQNAVSLNSGKSTFQPCQLLLHLLSTAIEFICLQRQVYYSAAYLDYSVITMQSTCTSAVRSQYWNWSYQFWVQFNCSIIADSTQQFNDIHPQKKVEINSFPSTTNTLTIIRSTAFTLWQTLPTLRVFPSPVRNLSSLFQRWQTHLLMSMGEQPVPTKAAHCILSTCKICFA